MRYMRGGAMFRFVGNFRQRLGVKPGLETSGVVIHDCIYLRVIRFPSVIVPVGFKSAACLRNGKDGAGYGS